MATKNNPGAYDCYEDAHPDEPMFVLLGRDRDASLVVKMWAMLRLQQIDLGIRPEADRPQISEALLCATNMEIWHREIDTARKMAALEFDAQGMPTTGQHARKERTSTSGANDG
jgi:hypothetical protein